MHAFPCVLFGRLVLGRISLLTPFNPPFEVNTTLYVFLATLRETLSDRIALPFQGVKEVEFD